jgi:hypothetical protein
MRCAVSQTKQRIIIPSELGYGLHLRLGALAGLAVNVILYAHSETAVSAIKRVSLMPANTWIYGWTWFS